MDNEISIVTAFFDIGRGDWTPDKGLPHYLQRTNATYIDRFTHLAELDNEMVIFTSEEFVEIINQRRYGKKTIVKVVDFHKMNTLIREQIKKVQANPTYQASIYPSQVKNPEYWNADYVLVNYLKSTFVKTALPYVGNDLVAWLDFGYCRDKSTLNGVTKWCYPFDKNKMHFFNLKDPKEMVSIPLTIANNTVYITGPCIVGGHDAWLELNTLVKQSLRSLLNEGLVDDDQTLLLMSYLQKPELFELHKVSEQDWFIAFKEFAIK